AEEKNPTEGARSLEESKKQDKVSYSMGLQIGLDLVRQKAEVNPDIDILEGGIKDALAGKPQLASEQVKEVLTQYQKDKAKGRKLPEENKKKVSYCIGQNIGFNLSRQKVKINPDVVIAGVNDAIAGKAELTQDQVKDVLTQFKKQVGEKNKTE